MKKTNMLLGIAVISFILFIIILINTGLRSGSDNWQEQTGYLSGWAKYPSHLNFNGDAWYVSDWYSINSYYPPNDIDKYFNHTVRIRYSSGCGRCWVHEIEIID